MDEHSTEVSTVRRDDAVDDPKEDLPLSARGMTATNAAGGTFGLGIDQFELPKASVMKLARSEVRVPATGADADPRHDAAAKGHNDGVGQVCVGVCELPEYVVQVPS